jgi:hypothetical protein
VAVSHLNPPFISDRFFLKLCAAIMFFLPVAMSNLDRCISVKFTPYSTFYLSVMGRKDRQRTIARRGNPRFFALRSRSLEQKGGLAPRLVSRHGIFRCISGL